MRDLLVVGMAYLDVFVPDSPPPMPGQEVFVDDIGISLGGASNSASVAAALGLDVTLCVPFGGGVADLALRHISNELGITLAPLAARDNPAVSLVFSNNAERAFTSAADFDALDQATTLPDASWILVPGLEEAARLAPALARARADGARIAVSGSWTPQRLGTLKQRTDVPWDLLVLNEKEAAAAGGQVYDAPRLLSGVAASVVVTLGAAGAYGVLNGEPVTAEAIVVPALDTTGAGDAFCAGLLAALIRGQRPACALAFAACAAAHLIGQRGGLLHDPARIRALVKEIAWRR